MAFTIVQEIIAQVIADITGPVQALIPGIAIHEDEPLELNYPDLPMVAVYPYKEDYIYEESFEQGKKRLALRVEVRLKGSPASSVASPVINTIVSALQADPWLGGLATYVEHQSIQWANAKTSSGLACGASLDIQVDYLI